MVLQAARSERHSLRVLGALLVFLATLAVAMGAAGERILMDGQERTSALAIVSLPAALDPQAGSKDRFGVIALLRADPEIQRVEPIPEEEVRQILAGADGFDLPLPVLMEVRFAPGLEPDLVRVTGLIRKVAPEAVLEDAGRLGGTADVTGAGFLRGAGMVGGGALPVSGVVLVAVVVAGRVRRQEERIDLLRWLGASDRFLARQFRPHAPDPILHGGLIGAGSAVLALAAISHGSSAPAWIGSAWPDFGPVDAIVLGLAGMLVAVLLAGAARFAVVRTLRRLP